MRRIFRSISSLNMKSKAYPHVHLDWELSADRIISEAKEIISISKEVQDRGLNSFHKLVAAIPSELRSFESVILPMLRSEGWENTSSTSCHFPQYVSENKDIREASVQAEKIINDHDIEMSMRRDVFEAVQHVYNSELSELTKEEKRAVEKMYKEFKRNGLDLNNEEKDKLFHLKQRLSDLSIEFSKNIGADQTTIEFDESELGLPADYIASLNRNSNTNKLIVTMKYPDVNPIFNHAKKEHVRKQLELVYGSRCKMNIALLEEALKLRREKAQLLGYNTHADFIIDVRMAKKTSAALEFLKDLQDRLMPLAKKELETLKELKRKDLNLTGDVQLNSWDFRYYHNLLMETEYKVNENEIKEYFSLDTVTKSMLDVYQHVLNLRFVEAQMPPVWHPDVRMFEVRDRTSNDMVGYFYLDLYPREGKYTHAACFGLQPGFENENGTRQFPIAAMVANFSKPNPTTNTPSLLRHSEVVTYFHELGHVMHQLCSRTSFSRFHGTKVERDFVEAPSQMLENWAWEPHVLINMSNHWQREGEKIPEETVKQLVASRNVNAGLMNRTRDNNYIVRQVFFAMFDLTIHSKELEPNESLNELWHRLREEISLIPGPLNTFPCATFGHIMGGYDAGYYGYLWSQVFSADMFRSRFLKEGIDNPKTGIDYRSFILQPGGSRDGMDMLKQFLGRAPTSDCFLESIGLKKD